MKSRDEEHTAVRRVPSSLCNPPLAVAACACIRRGGGCLMLQFSFGAGSWMDGFRAVCAGAICVCASVPCACVRACVRVIVCDCV